MANDNKKDTIDLKARLGLKKPTTKPASAPKSPARDKKPRVGGLAGLKANLKGTAPPPPEDDPETLTLTEEVVESVASAPRAPAAPSAPAQPAQAPAQPAPKRAAPPKAAAMGPPPTQARRAPAASADVSVDFDEALDLKSIGLTDDDVGIGLSAPTIVLMVLFLVVGLFFGFMASQSTQTRSIESARISDAQSMMAYLEPKLDAMAEAQQIIEGLDPMTVDFDATRRLADLDFMIGGDILPNNRLLLGRPVIAPLNRYMAESALLYERIQDHHRWTTRVDREELEALMEQREDFVQEEELALAFNFHHLRGYFMEPETYEPPEGRMVFLRDMEADDEHMVEVRRVDQDNPIRVETGSLIRLDVGDFFRIDRRNALERYEIRVNDLKYRSEEIGRRVEPLREAVAEIADRDRPSLLTIRGSTERYDEEMMEPLDDE